MLQSTFLRLMLFTPIAALLALGTSLTSMLFYIVFVIVILSVTTKNSVESLKKLYIRLPVIYAVIYLAFYYLTTPQLGEPLVYATMGVGIVCIGYAFVLAILLINNFVINDTSENAAQ